VRPFLNTLNASVGRLLHPGRCAVCVRSHAAKAGPAIDEVREGRLHEVDLVDADDVDHWFVGPTVTLFPTFTTGSVDGLFPVGAGAGCATVSVPAPQLRLTWPKKRSYRYCSCRD